MKKFHEDNLWEDKELKHGDYFLSQGSGWFHTKNFSVRIINIVGDDCFIEVFDNNGESLFKKEIKSTEVV